MVRLRIGFNVNFIELCDGGESLEVLERSEGEHNFARKHGSLRGFNQFGGW
ncbi:MAG: hypothetical protein ACTS40_01245 [Candidatus Hodgkinia cicadicola]